MTLIAAGSPVPSFTLKTGEGESFTQEDLQGETTVLVFYPFAFSGICTGELCEIRDNISVFADDDVQAAADRARQEALSAASSTAPEWERSEAEGGDGPTPRRRRGGPGAGGYRTF